MRDVTSYIGLPFKEFGRTREGLDCWGLFTLFYREQLGIELPLYEKAYSNTKAAKEIGSLVTQGLEGKWQEIKQGLEQFGDGIVLRLMGQPMHVGVIVKRGWFIHSLQGADTVLESYLQRIWEKRIIGIYRYVG